jgi:hypothetical protein
MLNLVFARRLFAQTATYLLCQQHLLHAQLMQADRARVRFDVMLFEQRSSKRTMMMMA